MYLKMQRAQKPVNDLKRETDPRGDDWEDDEEEPPPGSEDGNPDPPKDDSTSM